MENRVSLKSAERKAYQATFADGLWDVFIGCFFPLQFVIGPFLSVYLGDFWSSAIFLPVWGVVYLAIWLTRKYVVAPRIGTVRFGQVRKEKLRKFSLVMLSANILMFILGIIAALTISLSARVEMGWVITAVFSLSILAGFSMAGYMLDYPRLYLYGLLLFAAIPVGEWLYRYHGASHHGWPIAFGLSAALMITIGLVTFVRFLKNNPLVEIPEDGD